eukprot:7695100-Heterocapsa_arctica.AAC.1
MASGRPTRGSVAGRPKRHCTGYHVSAEGGGPCQRWDQVVDQPGGHGGTHAATTTLHGRSGDDG